METKPNGVIYYAWPVRGYLCQDWKSLFSVQQFNTKTALEYIADSCRQYFRHQAAKLGAQQDYHPGLDLYLYKLFPSASRGHSFPTGYQLDGELIASPTNSPEVEKNSIVYPAVTAEHRYGSPACRQDEVDFTKFDTLASAQPRPSLSLRLKGLFDTIHDKYRNFSWPEAYFADNDAKLWEDYPEEMSIVTGLDPRVDDELRGERWTFVELRGLPDAEIRPIFQNMIIDDSATFRFWKDYFARCIASVKSRACYNAEQDTFLWNLFPKGARSYYNVLAPPTHTQPLWYNKFNLSNWTSIYPASYYSDAYGHNRATKALRQHQMNENQRTLYCPNTDDDGLVLEVGDEDYQPSELSSTASDDSTDVDEEDAIEEGHLSASRDGLGSESGPLVDDGVSEVQFKMIEGQTFWDYWVSKLADAEIPHNYDGTKDLHMWDRFPGLMTTVCSTSQPDPSHLEWPHAFPPGPGPRDGQSILPHNALDNEQNLEERRVWLERTSSCASRQPHLDDFFLGLFFPLSKIQ